MTSAEYHADPCPQPSLSSSLAKLILDRSPLHAWTASPRLNPDWLPTERKTFDIGRAAHRAALGRGEPVAIIPYDVMDANGNATTKAAKEFIAEAREAGMTPIKPLEADSVAQMAEKARAALAEMGITLDPARSELVATAQIDGIWCRAMIDNAPADPRLPLYDFKTCEDASPEAVIRAVMNYRYDIQAAHYLAVWEAATGEKRKFRFIFQEKAAPHEVAVVQLHDNEADEADWMLDARSKAREARRLWAECLTAGHWPGYPARVAVIGAPSYYRQKWADRPVGATKISSEAIARASAWQAPEAKQ